MCDSLLELVKANHDSLVQNIRDWFDEQLDQKRRLAPPTQTNLHEGRGSQDSARDVQCDMVHSQAAKVEVEPEREALRELKAPEPKLREVDGQLQHPLEDLVADSMDTADGAVPTTRKNASWKAATTCDDGTLSIIDMESGNVEWKCNVGLHPWDVGWSPNAEALAVGTGDGRVDIIDVDSKKTVRMVQHEGPVWSLEWHPRGSLLATGCGDALLRIIDAQSGQVERIIQTDGPIFALSWNRPGTRIAIGAGCKLSVQRHPSGQEDFKVTQPDILHETQWQPHGSKLATATANVACILDGETGHVQHQVVYPDKLWSISWHPSGSRLAAGGADWKVHIINAESGLVERSCTHPGVGVVRCINWHPDGLKIAVASDAQKLYLWDGKSGGMAEKQVLANTIWAVKWKPGAV